MARFNESGKAIRRESILISHKSDSAIGAKEYDEFVTLAGENQKEFFHDLNGLKKDYAEVFTELEEKIDLHQSMLASVLEIKKAYSNNIALTGSMLAEKDRIIEDLRVQLQEFEDDQKTFLAIDTEKAPTPAVSEDLNRQLREQSSTTKSESAQEIGTLMKSLKAAFSTVYHKIDDIYYWCNQVRGAIELFPLSSDRVQLTYVLSLVGSDCSKQVELRSRKDSPNKWKTAEEVLEKLEIVYGTSNRKVKARQEFRKLYQNNRPFSEFWQEFQELSAELEYSQQALIDEFLDRVNDDMKIQLANKGDFTDLSALGKECGKIDERLSIIRKSNRPSKSSSFTTKATPETADKVRAVTPRSNSETPRRRSRDRTADSPEEYQKDLNAGNCFRCHKPGHRSAHCPEQAWNKGKVLAAIEAEDQEEKDQPPA